jgi:phage terminase large subunit
VPTAAGAALAVPTPEAFAGLHDALGTYRYRVFYGGRGSAKSWQFARALLVHGMTQPIRVLCAREYQASIRDSVHRVLADQIALLDLGHVYTVQEATIIGRTGTEFIFKGLRRDIAQIKSTEGIDVCWIEEAESVSEHSWTVLIPTIRKTGSEIWVSFNPAQASDPTYQRFVVRQPDRALVRKVSWRDNRWFPDVLREEARAMRRADPEAFAHVWDGEPWARSDAQVLAGKWRVAEFEPEPHWAAPLYGADWGFSQDPTVLVKLYVHDGRLWIADEAGGIQLDTDATVRAFDTVSGSRDHTIRADSARPETIAEIKKRGFRIVAAPKWTGSVEDGIQHLRSYAEIVIHPRCKRWQEEARLYRYKIDARTNDVLPQLVDAHNHAMDATRYALAPLIKRSATPFVV